MMPRTQIMGILNLTPDSFHAASRTLDPVDALARAQQLETEGADWLDIGGESSRPGSEPVSEAEECARVLPVIEQLRKQVQIPLSIDTVKPRVAAQAVAAGVSMINDISGFSHPGMVEVAASCSAKLCLMHMQGQPKTMQHAPHYSDGIITDLLHWFDQRLNQLEQAGVSAQRVILDPGIGFGKTVTHNLEILHNLHRFKIFGLPILIGCSRKWFLRQLAGKERPEEVLPETLAVHTIACLAGVDIIRVHDVEPHLDMTRVIAAYRNSVVLA